MSSNITIVGNLVADPQEKGEGDSKRAIFTVAVEDGRDDNAKTSFVNVTAFRALGRNILKSPGMKRGKSVIVEGRLNGYKKAVVLDGEEKEIQMLSVTAFHAGPDLLWQTVEVSKVSNSSGSGSSGNAGGSAGSGDGGKAKAASDNSEDF